MPQSLDNFIQRIHEQIEVGKVDLALEQLKNYLSSLEIKDLQNDVTMLLSRFNHLRSEERNGFITRETAVVDRTKIVNSLLYFLSDLPNQIKPEKYPNIIYASLPARFSLPDDTAFEAILGAVSNLKQISWIEEGLKLSSSVCRVITPNFMGTGFLISPTCIMTNNHVIPNEKVAENSCAEFNYQLNFAGKKLPTYRYKLDSKVFHTNDNLDYTFVGIESSSELPKTDQWGNVELDSNANPMPGEHVIIIQHPDGGPKQICILANQIINIENDLIYYTTDTMPGSSGSPVFNDHWKVIAIHHAYGGLKKDIKGNDRYVNEGILMSAIKPYATIHWP